MQKQQTGTDTVFQDSFSQEIWSLTYKDYKDETVDDTMRRVANHIASAETTPELKAKWAHNFYDLLTNFKAVGGGRISANAGTEWGGTTLANCYVGPLPGYDLDSIEGIYKVLVDQANTLKSEGGWGMDFSWIRPRGSFIKGVGVESPGSVRFMELFDKSSEIVTAGSGKKTAKKEAKGRIRKGAMMGTLACISGNTPVDTLEGKIPVKDLVGKNPYLYCTDQKGNVYVRQALLVFSKGVKKTIRVTFDNGDFIEATPDHEFLLSSGKFVEAGKLKVGDSLAALNKTLYSNGYLYLGVAGSRTSIAEHNAVYEMKYGSYPTSMTPEKRTGDMTIAHHVDHSKVNNHPDNILRMTVKEHSIHHGDLLEEHRARIAAERKGRTWEEYYGTEKAQEVKAKYTSKRKGQKPWNKGLVGEEYKVHYETGFSNQFVENTNHKVLKIENVGDQEVFDISMPDYHNFSANGVFIHNCWHPDIVEFITAKQTAGRLTKFNVSVNCTDEFMAKVNAIANLKRQMETVQSPNELWLASFKITLQGRIDEQDKWELIFPETTHPAYKKEWQGDIQGWQAKGYPVNVYETTSVTKLWNLIMESTYNRNEPGVLFLDRANHYLPLNYAERILSTNPCGEQTLAPGGVCCLGTLNLTQFVLPDGSGFDLAGIAKYTGYLVRFLDNVNSVSAAPLPEYEHSMRKKRRIGAGVMGWGSALFMLGVRFGSERAAELREQVMSTYARAAYMASIDLAEEKGKFEYCDPVKHAEGAFVKSLGLSEEYMAKLRRVGIRNSSCLSQQPNGNGSIYANISSGGMEPVFMPEYIRTVIVAVTPDHLKAVTPNYHVGEFHETEFFKFSKEGDEDILRGVDDNGTVWKIDRNRGLTKEVLCEDYGVRYLKQKGLWNPKAEYAVTTTELTVSEHVDDLKGFARWTDSACSKTCNIPYDYPFEDFKNLYLEVYNTGVIKGFTTYRAGTMTSVLSAVKETEQTEQTEEEIILDEIKLPDSLPATLKTIKSEGRKWYLTVIMNDTQTRPVAVFVQTNAHEKSITANDAVDHLEALAKTKGIPQKYIDETLSKTAGDNNPTKIARMISLNLRHGVLIRNVVSALDKVDCFAGTFVFHIRKFLSTFIKDGERVAGEKCQECGSEHVVYQEGCKICQNCGSSKCG